MIKDLLLWSVKMTLQLFFWTFILSIRFEGRTLFDRAHDILIDNEIVEYADEHLSELWYKISATAKKTFSEISSKELKKYQ